MSYAESVVSQYRTKEGCNVVLLECQSNYKPGNVWYAIVCTTNKRINGKRVTQRKTFGSMSEAHECYRNEVKRLQSMEEPGNDKQSKVSRRI